VVCRGLEWGGGVFGWDLLRGYYCLGNGQVFEAGWEMEIRPSYAWLGCVGFDLYIPSFANQILIALREVSWTTHPVRCW
jgi:hypothetical protein